MARLGWGTGGLRVSMGTVSTQTSRHTTDAGSHRRHTAEPAQQPLSAGVQSVLLALQHRSDGPAGPLLDAFAGKAPAGAGHALDEPTRIDMEARFGQDFSCFSIPEALLAMLSHFRA